MIIRCYKRIPMRLSLINSGRLFLAKRSLSSNTNKYVSLPEVEIDGSNEVAMAQNLAEFHEKQKPVILCGAASHFPAVSKWNNWDYLLERIGPDWPCEVEIGMYNKGERVTIPFDQYVQYLQLWKAKHDSGERVSRDQLLYLAQNDLPHQLVNDIKVPSLCTDEKLTVGHGKLYHTMLWLGPAGCLSPLHFDPLDNLLMQMVGRKKVFLIDKKVESNLVYRGEGSDQQNNTSAIEDIESPDLNRFPRFGKVPEIQIGTLEPGDMLFIPSKWWHAIRSLDFSVSVNAWWR